MKKLCFLVLMVGMLTGCSTESILLNRADSFANETVGPEYEEYVMNDATLSGAQKRVRIENNLESFRALIQELKDDAR